MLNATMTEVGQFRDDVEIVTNLFFYECKVVHIRQGQSF